MKNRGLGRIGWGVEVKGQGDVNEEKGYGNGFWKKGRVLGKGSGKREGRVAGGWGVTAQIFDLRQRLGLKGKW